MSIKTLAGNGFKLGISVLMVTLTVLLGFVGNLLLDLNKTISHPETGLVAKVSKLTTVQEQVLAPGLGEVKGGLTVLTDNLLNQPRFDKNDAQRLDDSHRKIMEGHDARLRELEARGGWPE